MTRARELRVRETLAAVESVGFASLTAEERLDVMAHVLEVSGVASAGRGAEVCERRGLDQFTRALVGS